MTDSYLLSLVALVEFEIVRMQLIGGVLVNVEKKTQRSPLHPLQIIDVLTFSSAVAEILQEEKYENQHPHPPRTTITTNTTTTAQAHIQ